MHGHSQLSSVEELFAASKSSHVTSTTAGNEVLSSDVPEARVYYPWMIVLSDTSAAANTVTVQKVEEGGATTDILPNFNLAANESRVLDGSELGLAFEPLEGGTNMEFTAGANNVEATVFYLQNEV